MGLGFSARHSPRPLIRVWFRPDGTLGLGCGQAWSKSLSGALPHSVGRFEMPVGYPTNPERVSPPRCSVLCDLEVPIDLPKGRRRQRTLRRMMYGTGAETRLCLASAPVSIHICFLSRVPATSPTETKSRATQTNVDRVAVTDAARTLLVDVSDHAAHISLQVLHEGAAAMTTSSRARAFPCAKVLG